jgi:ribosomal protein L11 methyltransferase
MSDVPDCWFAVDVTVTSPAAEAVESVFNGLDTLGTEINQLGKKESSAITVTGYFATAPVLNDVRKNVIEHLLAFGFKETDLERIGCRPIENTDWLAEWKKYWRPTPVGRFVISPPWESVADTEGIVISIEPNMAFGTGTHDTTQLCLKVIGGLYDPDQSFLDVGTGTGILAIAAAKLGGTRIFACDTDAHSVAIARENAAINGAGVIEFADGSIDDDTPVSDFVCANLTVDVIVPLLPLLLAKSRSTLLLSGILDEQESIVTGELAASGLTNFTIDRSGEWISVTVNISSAF